MRFKMRMQISLSNLSASQEETYLNGAALLINKALKAKLAGYNQAPTESRKTVSACSVIRCDNFLPTNN
ncbi:hypothetical protein NST02_20075 [Robertmurraya sp. FSL W8-0741]|uniref:hypothetical protein n=1 Tax=Robertmurraya sp. FSL W8-0741 TaxID=2954629 RepID=UPI0030F98635